MAIKKQTTKTDSAPPPTLDISEDNAAYAIGKEAGYQQGLRDGAEREGVGWEMAQIEAEKARLAEAAYLPSPRSALCHDRVLSWWGYAVGVSVTLAIMRITWEIILGQRK